MTKNHKTITRDYHPNKDVEKNFGIDLTSPEVLVHPKSMESGRSLVWSRTSACHADDPGSNLGDRTISTI
jgi:hypothetical protein